jgi:hypothetical protein
MSAIANEWQQLLGERSIPKCGRYRNVCRSGRTFSTPILLSTRLEVQRLIAIFVAVFFDQLAVVLSPWPREQRDSDGFVA